MKITAPAQDQSTEALLLLRKAALPADDIDSSVELFVLTRENQVAGVVGLQSNGEVGLLRSLCVDAEQRGKGYGEELVNFLEATAKQRGLRTLYLLTTTAASFFAKHGYETINRQTVPEFIMQTKEFSSLCPSSAMVMRKNL